MAEHLFQSGLAAKDVIAAIVHADRYSRNDKTKGLHNPPKFTVATSCGLFLSADLAASAVGGGHCRRPELAGEPAAVRVQLFPGEAPDDPAEVSAGDLEAIVTRLSLARSRRSWAGVVGWADRKAWSLFLRL